MNFKILKIIMLFLALGVISCSKNLDDVIKGNLKAHGGDAVTALKTIQVDAGLISGGQNTTYKMLLQFPDKIRFEFVSQGKQIASIVNGDKGWLIIDTTMQEYSSMNLKELKEEISKIYENEKNEKNNNKKDQNEDLLIF